MIHGHCTVHPATKLLCPSCMGGRSTPAKVASSKQNAKKGGRPKKEKRL